MRHPANRVSLFLFLCVCALAVCAPAAVAETAIRFTLDRRVDGTAAPFLLAPGQGLYRAQDLDVTTNAALSSQDAIARVAKGDSNIALADLNELIRYRDRPDAVPVKAVMILHNKNAYAIIARRSRGVAALTDLGGKTLGVAEGDLAIKQWLAVAKQNSVDVATIKIDKIGAAVREPMLSAGQVDAVTGLSFASALNLRDRGVPASDLIVFRFADFGDRSYGLALIVNPAFAAAKPEAVKGFVRATIEAVKFAAKSPAKALDEVMNQMESSSRELELERLRTVLRDNILTADVRRNGLGGIDRDRFEDSIQQIGVDFKFRQKPALADIFDDAFLPAPGSRKID